MAKVNLIALTQPSAISGCHTAEELVAYAARVSNPANQNNKKTAKGLVKYLIKEGHWSPFEMVNVTARFHIKSSLHDMLFLMMKLSLGKNVYKMRRTDKTL